MPLQVVEAVASFGGFSRTHAAQLGTLVHLKSLIYKHSIIILIFQGTQIKAYKNICLMLAAGIEPAKPEQAKKGAICTPLKLNITKIALHSCIYNHFPIIAAINHATTAIM